MRIALQGRVVLAGESRRLAGSRQQSAGGRQEVLEIAVAGVLNLEQLVDPHDELGQGTQPGKLRILERELQHFRGRHFSVDLLVLFPFCIEQRFVQLEQPKPRGGQPGLHGAFTDISRRF